MDVAPALLETAERKLSKVEPFLDASGWVEVGFTEEQNPRIADKFHCEIVAHVKGRRLKVEGSAPDALSALEQAASRIEKQVRRLKDKRVRRRRGNGAPSTGEMPLVPPPDVVAPEPEAPDMGEGPAGPAIVEMGEADGKPMTPTEAAMQLDLLELEFMLFHNSETSRAAVIYRRRDGDYGLVESSV